MAIGKNKERLGTEQFQEEKPKKVIKKTSRYTVLLIPDSTDHSKTFELTFDHILRIIAGIIALLLVLISLLISSGMKNYRLAHDDTDKKQIEQLQGQIEQLKQEKAELYEQIVSLTDVVAQKQENERSIEQEKVAAAVPNGYPIEGYALIVQDPTVDVGEKVKGRVVFNTIIGTAIVASGDGVVAATTEDADFGTQIVIDHGNGYQTVYRCAGSAKVRPGDEVKRQEVLFVITEEDSLFAYEIVKNGEEIEPLDMMDVQG
ncbi:MAG: M23 family metallopeptidase [Lachnospiraceae bacterium]|nr:M23 family metallopeptidase [Lachnospiraceae bacterium]